MTSSLVDRAASLVPELATRRARHDAARRLDPEVIAALRSHDMFAALVPRELGGHELCPVDYLSLLETLARGDSATAWCVMTASTSTLLAAYLPRATAAEIWSGDRPAPFLAGVFAPSGTVAIGETSARLSGRWSWASGSRHAEWFVVGALADRRHVVCVVPATAVEIVDNWDTIGLGGTGSHDIVIDDVEVPASHVTSVFDRAPWTEGALYRVPMFGLLALGITGCALGIARAAIDHVGAKLVAESPSTTWLRYADLRARLEAARAYAMVAARDAFAAASPGPVPPAVRGAVRLAACHATATCTEIARSAFHLGGGSSVRTGSALGDALRDLETVLTHKMVADRVMPAAARATLGIGTAPPDL